MGTTLTGTTPQDTYDSLIKVTDNGPISGTAKFLSDGLGNDSALAVSTTAVGIGTASPTAGSKLTLSGTSSSAYIARIVQTNTTNSDSFGLFLAAGTDNSDSAFRVQNAAQNANLFTIQGAGNVGIGTSSPSAKLDIKGGNGDQLLLNNAGERFTQISFSNNSSLKAAIWSDETNDEFALFAASGYTTPIYANGAERVRVTANGLTFNGDTAAANALDDYEEGTWTMGVSFNNASVGVTYDINTGTYTKIGRQVTVNGYVILTSKGSSTGTARITGLPFTIANDDSNYVSASLYFENITFANQFQGYGGINTTAIVLSELTEAGVLTVLNNANFADNSGLMVSLTYFV
jgi:hypothetical protein